jgi:demethylmenaquinone methyltransferase/2-methoxy-6-polyprenyl-1,4-benzoquinol methylase
MKVTIPDDKSGSPNKDESPRMFDRIAPRYDLLNRLLSMRRDVSWRRQLADRLPDRPGLALLDVATGTADVLLTALGRRDNITRAIGLDPSGNMLQLGRRKIEEQGFGDTVSFVRGDAEAMPFPDNSFDVLTIAFGIRNVPRLTRGLAEMCRVLKPGGTALILEFSLPASRLLRKVYLIYFRYLLPRLGALISGDRGAYRYLNRTVEDFPYGQAFGELMTSAGFSNVSIQPLTFGIASIYSGTKI